MCGSILICWLVLSGCKWWIVIICVDINLYDLLLKRISSTSSYLFPSQNLACVSFPLPFHLFLPFPSPSLPLPRALSHLFNISDCSFLIAFCLFLSRFCFRVLSFSFSFSFFLFLFVWKSQHKKTIQQ